ncbi:MAG: copper resistance protein CopC [Actinomycetota bacterium]|nr:copper resistance protein CopC [Actinomycetota bacterium]
MIRRVGCAVALAAILMVASPSAAFAHAGFVSSTPEPGAILGSAPGQVSLTFSEPLNTRLSRVAVRTPDGSSVAGHVVGDDGMVVDLTTGQPGVYEVDWTTVSLVDGHTLSGSFRFGVGVSPGAGAEGGTTDEPTGWDLLIAIGRLVEDASLLLVVGLLLLGRLARRDPPITWARTPTLLAFALAFAGGIAVVLGEALRAAPSPAVGAVVAYLTTDLPGWSRLARVVLEGVGILAAWRWPRAQAPLAVAAIIALAAAGHATAVQPRAWGVTVEAVHVLSAGLWAGGILALALLRPPDRWLGEGGRTLLDRFTPVALASFAVTVGTGAIRGVQEVGGWAGLFGSLYGLVLVVKILLVLTMVQASVLAWRRIAIFPRGEAAAAALVIGAAALLSAFPLPPARQVEAAEGPSPSAASGAPIPAGGALTLGSHAGPVLVGLTLSPAAPGSNMMTIYVQSLDGPAATAALPVKAAVNGEPVTLTQCADTCRKGRAKLRGGDRVTVDVGTPAGGRVEFSLPPLPTASGEQVLTRMQATMGAVTSYRLDEELTSGLGTSIRTNYAFVTPNSFESRGVNSGTAFGIVWIGDTRWLRKPNGTWQVERGASAPPVPSYIWDYFKPYRDVRIVGSAVVDGVPTTKIAFAGGDQDLPIWFQLWVDAKGLVHRAQMRAPGHFMDHRYYDFDAPITIAPPTGPGATG